MTSRRLTVMLHFEGERRLERDVNCFSVNDLLNQLERRIGYRIHNAHFFNPYTDSYQILTAHDFETLPRNVELQIVIDPERRDVGPSATMQSAKHQLPYKARVIETLRKLLLPLFNSGMISKDEMIAVCSQLCREFVDRRGLTDEELASVKREVSLREQELLRQMVKAYRESALPEYDEVPGRVSLMDRNDHAPSQRRSLHLGTGTTTRTRGVRPSRIGSPVSGARGGGTHPAAHRRPSHHELFPQQPDLTRSSGRHQRGYFRHPSDAIYERQTPSPPRDDWGDGFSNGGGGGGFSQLSQQQEQPPDTMFRAVSYTVAGTFPSIPPGNARIGDGNLRCTLTAPALSESDQDVIISGTVHSATNVTLCWWLAYGPQRIVLNLDKMYAAQFVTTYQVSDTALILAFRSGALVPGWEYFVHLTVTSTSGTTAMAQAAFVVPSAPGTAACVPAIGSRASANEMVSGSASVMNSRTAGYFADTERGRLRVQHDGADGESNQGAAAAADGAQGPAGNNSGAAAAATPRNASPRHVTHAAAVTAAAKNGLPMEYLDASGRVVSQRPAETLGASSQFEVASGTYQEQLRAFFTDQIEPLYFLSSCPSMSEERFKTLVKDCAKRFWFRHPPEHTLDDETRREIVRDIKHSIGSARAQVDTS